MNINALEIKDIESLKKCLVTKWYEVFKIVSYSTLLANLFKL